MQPHRKDTAAAGEAEKIRESAASALAAIQAAGTSAEAFAAATRLAATVSQLGRTVADYRAWLAADMLDSGQADSLQDVADQLGISKARAQQLVDNGRKRGNPVASADESR